MLYETMEIGPIYFNQINNLAVLYNQHEHFEQIKWKNTLSEVETEAITKKNHSKYYKCLYKLLL